MYIVQTMKTEHVNPQEPKCTDKESLVVLQNSIPLALCMMPQWVCWRYEDEGGCSKPDKVPYHPVTGIRVDVTKDIGVKPFGAAYHEYTYSKGYDGIGYVLSSQDTVVGIDLDDCLDERVQLSPMAQAVIKLVDSYSEFSPSGNGIRIFSTAALGDFAGARRGSIELYNFNRYLTVTGHHIYGTPTTMKPRLEALRELFRRYLAPPEHSTTATQYAMLPSAADCDVISGQC